MLYKKYNDSPEENEEIILNIEEDTPSTVPELSAWIDERIENKPDGRNKKAFGQWKHNINILIEMVNRKAGFIMYKIIK